MSEGMNRATLLGGLGMDPELRMTNGGQAVLNMRLATTESYLDKDKVRKERTDWHSVVCFGRRAEALAKILVKGSQVLIEGRICTSSYEKDGVKRYKTEIIANEVYLCGGKRDGAGQSEHSSGGGGARHTTKPAGGDDYGFGGGDNQEADLPFISCIPNRLGL